MSDSFSASGLRVQTPCGPRKSGMPESVEMPAPVSTTTRLAESIQLRAASRVALLMVVRVRGDSSPFSSLELVESLRIIHQELLSGSLVGRTLPEEVIELHRAHLVVEGKMRIVAAPDQPVG